MGPQKTRRERRSRPKRKRGKKSITLDLKSAEGHALFLRVVEHADVVVENFTVGVTERLKINWPALRKINPKLVYCSITGYGATGPDAKRRAYDLTTQAMSGLMSVTGHPGNPPTKAGTPMGDTISAGFAFSAILGALFHRERTCEGQHIDISMTDVLLAFDEASTSTKISVCRFSKATASCVSRLSMLIRRRTVGWRSGSAMTPCGARCAI